jgi:hypothetical protein
MSATPIQVLTRPFAVEPVTNVMLPDGIFDNAIYNLRITAHFTNMSSAPLANVTLYLESVGDPGIVPQAQTFAFAILPAGASVRVGWNANFQFSAAGKRLVSFMALADGFTSRRSIQQIFVSQTRFDAATNTYTCTVEEGTLTISGVSAIAPSIEWGQGGLGDKCRCAPRFGPYVPTGLTMAWAPSPAYAGLHGDLPFSDPWWKILAVIVAVIAAVVAIVAAAEGSGKAVFSVGGTFEETQPTVHCCTPKGAASGKPDPTVAGVASTIASLAIVVALSDDADPFFRGQAATPPQSGETTLGERVVATWSLPEAPNAGKAYPADVKWTYARYTTSNTYTHSVAETQVNQHAAGNVALEVPPLVHAFDPLWVRVIFNKTSGEPFKGTELYAFALFQAPQGLFFVVGLADDGLSFDNAANDGVYAGELNLEAARKLLLSEGQDVYGTWRIYVFAQDVNLTQPGTPPEIAAQHIGGFFVASAIEITFDPSLPCPLKAQASITVV